MEKEKISDSRFVKVPKALIGVVRGKNSSSSLARGSLLDFHGEESIVRYFFLLPVNLIIADWEWAWLLFIIISHMS